MYLVCLILEYVPLKPGSRNVLPPSPPPPPPPSFAKKNVEVWPEYFCSRLNNIDQGRVGEGVTMVPNSQGESPLSKKVQNSLTLFVQDCGRSYDHGFITKRMLTFAKQD